MLLPSTPSPILPPARLTSLPHRHRTPWRVSLTHRSLKAVAVAVPEVAVVEVAAEVVVEAEAVGLPRRRRTSVMVSPRPRQHRPHRGSPPPPPGHPPATHRPAPQPLPRTGRRGRSRPTSARPPPRCNSSLTAPATPTTS